MLESAVANKGEIDVGNVEGLLRETIEALTLAVSEVQKIAKNPDPEDDDDRDDLIDDVDDVINDLNDVINDTDNTINDLGEVQGVCGKKVGDMTWGGRGGQPSP